jgi:hypothetical protein
VTGSLSLDWLSASVRLGAHTMMHKAKRFNL